jgi:hypothetical protein
VIEYKIIGTKHIAIEPVTIIDFPGKRVVILEMYDEIVGIPISVKDGES